MKPVRVAVLGAAGRMGGEVCRALQAAPDLELVAELGAGDSLDRIAQSGATVAVDFTHPAAVMANVRRCIGDDVHVVIGTSGIDAPRLAEIRSLLEAHPETGVLVAPNFGIGAVLMMRFAAMAAPLFPSVEIVEYHHPDKVDAPSGTAYRTAELVAAARTDMPPAPDATGMAAPGARGADIDGVPVHSVRLRGLVAHQEVIFGGPGETLTVRHDSLDRSSFMPGVLLGVRGVSARPGLTVGLENFLDLG
jgi:4-hydroxy-tetrahydrodipicolinate reductase